MRRKNKPMPIALMLLFIASILLNACTLLPEEKVSAPPPLVPPPDITVVQEKVVRGYIARELSGLARVSASKDARLYFKRDGRIGEILVEQNENVKQGEELLRLETGDLEYEYQLARLEYEKEELNYNRYLKLKSIGGSITDHDFDRQRLDFKISKLKLKKSEEDLNNSIIFAPFDSRITNISVQQGQSVTAYDNVIRIVDDSEVELQMNINREYINQISTGMKARIRLNDGSWLAAQVSSIVLASRQNERQLILKLVDKEKTENLKYDSTYRVRLILEENNNALILPRAVIREYMGRSYVRVLEGETRKDVNVELGIQTESQVEILDGLEEGEIVVGN